MRALFAAAHGVRTAALRRTASLCCPHVRNSAHSHARLPPFAARLAHEFLRAHAATSHCYSLSFDAAVAHSRVCHYATSAMNASVTALLSGFETVYALSSAPGKAGVSVVRVSGPRARDALLSLSRAKSGESAKLPPPRTAVMRTIVDPETNEAIDHGLVLWFPGPRSATGEDVCEFHVHGGVAVIRGVLGALARVNGLRMAEPGEFSKRAFLNGKMDLTAAEGLGDLINAETEAQRKQALRQLSGDLGRLYEGWSARLVKALAHIEAVIDFSEDADIDDGVVATELAAVADIERAIQRHLSDGRRGERLRSGVHASIGGVPNVGKSSLLNALCQRPAAIVSPIAGTTRDVVDVALNVRGYPLLLSDTAGLRRTPSDAVEEEGIRRARERIASSDLRIWVVDATARASADDADYRVDGADVGADGVVNMVVCNKIDLVADKSPAALATSGCIPAHLAGWPVFPVSCVTGEGVGAFVDALGDALREKCESGNVHSEPGLTQARHREALVRCQEFLRMAMAHPSDVAIAAEGVRHATRHLGRITGRVDIEAILDVIFRDFCIGK